MPDDSGFTFEGKPIMVGKKRGRPPKYWKGAKLGYYPDELKLEAAKQYAAVGVVNKVAQNLGIPESTLRKWKGEAWFQSIVEQIREENKDKFDSKATNVIDEALEAILDRLTNGDYIYDQKTGEIRRKPVTMKDSIAAVNSLVEKRNLLRGEATTRSEKVDQNQQMQQLADAFAKFSRQKVEVVKDAQQVSPPTLPSPTDPQEGIQDEGEEL